MMLIVRLFPKVSKEDLWKSAVETVPKMTVKDVKPLYISHQAEYDYISIVF